MGKKTPLMFIMFAVVMVSASIIGLSSYYGSGDWTWIAQQVASFTLILMVFGLAFYTLMGWLRK